MGFEEMLVRFLNRRRPSNDAPQQGLSLGHARTLIGYESHEYRWPWRPEHAFSSGRTGMGKTTFLMRIMTEHFRERRPFLFEDCHGPAIDELLGEIGRSADPAPVLLLEPWTDPVIGWNPLEASGQSPYAIVQELVAIFHHRLWPDAWGPRLEELLKMTLLALVEAKLTLIEATPFLSQSEFRRRVLQQVSLSEVREFWISRFERLAPSQKALVTETVLNKLSVFHDPTVRYIVGQQPGSLDFDRLLASGQTLLVNLASGQLRGNSYLLGALLLAKFKTAVYRRSIAAKPYSIVLDEFQELMAAEAVDEFLRSFRKFQCAVFLATQTLNLVPELKAAIFGNCSRFCCFATSAADAVALSREFGPPDGELVANLLPELPCGQALVKVRAHPVQLLQVRSPGKSATVDEIARGRERCLQGGRYRRDIDAAIRARAEGLMDDTPRARVVPSIGGEQQDNLPEGYEGF
jgi:hypothetical protein